MIELAPGVRVASLLRDLGLRQRPLRSSHRDGNRIRISRRLDDRTPGPLCSPDYNAQLAQTMRRIMPVLREQLVYLAPGAHTE